MITCTAKPGETVPSPGKWCMLYAVWCMGSRASRASRASRPSRPSRALGCFFVRNGLGSTSAISHRPIRRETEHTVPFFFVLFVHRADHQVPSLANNNALTKNRPVLYENVMARMASKVVVCVI